MNMTWLQFGFNALIVFLNVVVFITIKFNDMRHLKIEIEDTKQNSIKMANRVDAVCTALENRIKTINDLAIRLDATCKQRCSSTDRMLEILLKDMVKDK